MEVEKGSEALKFLDDLKAEVLNHPVMRHPFWRRFREDRLAKSQTRVFLLHYYEHVKRTRLYAATVLARTPFEQIQGAIASVLWDEYGQGDMEQTHPAQFRKLLRVVHLTEDDWDSSPVLPELEMYSDVHFRLCTDYNVWVGLGVIGIAMELPIPVLYEHLVDGFRKSGLTEDDLEFFVKHGPMDVQHANLLLSAMVPHLAHLEDRQALRFGALRSMEARSILMDGLTRVVWKDP